MDPFKVLGVKRGASSKEIKIAFRTLVTELHPDTSIEPAEDRFNQVMEAYGEIKTDEKRSAYFKRGVFMGTMRKCSACIGKGKTYIQKSFTSREELTCLVCEGSGFISIGEEDGRS